MPAAPAFPPLSGFEPTRQTLQLYGRALALIPRAHAKRQPHWWRLSLKLQPGGRLATERGSLPAGGQLWGLLDLARHEISLLTDEGPYRHFDMAAGRTASEFGDTLLAAAGELGLHGRSSISALPALTGRRLGPNKHRASAPGRVRTSLRLPRGQGRP
ncbi:MAG: DUF5996 family protein [Candidatus Promineifilaceae bacterium]